MALTALHNVSTMSRPYNGMDTIRARIGKPDGSDRAHSETWLARLGLPKVALCQSEPKRSAMGVKCE